MWEINSSRPNKKQWLVSDPRFKPVLEKLIMFLSLIFIFSPAHIYAQQRQVVKQDLFSVIFPTELDGWACGRWGTVIHTKDGGKTWVQQKIKTDYTLNSIYFTDSKNGWAVGDEGTIIHSKDGGENWRIQKSPVKHFLMSVHFADMKKGWIVTERTTILYTEDGGENWEIQSSDEDFILKAVSFCDPLNGWAVGEFGYTYHTTNGGKTWEHQAGFFDFSEETGDMIGGDYLFDVKAINPTTAWVVGIDGYIAFTTDSGKTWQRILNNIPKIHLFSVSLNRNGDIVIGGNGTLIVSADNGNSFRKPSVIEPPIIYGWIYGITPIGGSGFAAVGKGGWIYISNDNGESWRY